MDYRLVHFNCARPMGQFDFSNEFVQVFVALLPRIFKDGDAFEGLIHHNHGLRCPDGSWRGFTNAFPYPPEWRAPDISTLAIWRSMEDLKAFSHNGRTHPPGMRRLAGEIDRSDGPGFVMWWAPKGEPGMGAKRSAGYFAARRASTCFWLISRTARSPRAASPSASAMPGERCPPVPPQESR